MSTRVVGGASTEPRSGPEGAPQGAPRTAGGFPAPSGAGEGAWGTIERRSIADYQRAGKRRARINALRVDVQSLLQSIDWGSWICVADMAEHIRNEALAIRELELGDKQSELPFVDAGRATETNFASRE